jgi:hypothetical protein
MADCEVEEPEIEDVEEVAAAIEKALAPFKNGEAAVFALISLAGRYLAEHPCKDCQNTLMQSCLQHLVEACGVEYRRLDIDLDDEPEEKELH